MYKPSTVTPKTKAIAYAFATSTTADFLGMPNGCWFVEVRRGCQVVPSIEHNCEGYDSPNHPDLISFYNETDGEHCEMFLHYGNTLSLAALGLERKKYVIK